MTQVFISYSRKDVSFARRIAESITEEGVDVWIDLEDIHAGSKWSESIQAGLDQSQAMVIIISPTSMASGNVRDEWQYFLDHNKPVIPILYKPAKIHFQLNRIQYVDFNKQSFQQGLAQLQEQLRLQGVPVQGVTDVNAVTPFKHMVIPRDKNVRYWVLGTFVVMMLIVFSVILVQNRPNETRIDIASTTIIPAPTNTATPISNNANETLENTRELCAQPENSVSIRIHVSETNNGFANIRSGPGSTYDVVVNALEGDVFMACYSLQGFNAEQEQIDWYQIAHPIGRLLYVSSEIVEIVNSNESIDQLPQATVIGTRDLGNSIATSTATDTPPQSPPTPVQSGGGE